MYLNLSFDFTSRYVNVVLCIWDLLCSYGGRITAKKINLAKQFYTPEQFKVDFVDQQSHVANSNMKPKNDTPDFLKRDFKYLSNKRAGKVFKKVIFNIYR